MVTSELQSLQIMLLEKIPESGPVMEGTGGIRKVRFPLRKSGKKRKYPSLLHKELAEYEVTYLITAFEKKSRKILLLKKKMFLKNWSNH